MVAFAAGLKIALLLCVLVGTGLALARTSLARRGKGAAIHLLGVQRLALLLAAVIAAATFGLLVYRLAGTLDLSIAGFVADSPPGYSAALIVLGALLAMAQGPGPIGGLLMIAAFAVSGHAPSQSVTDGVVVALHVAAGAWWTGGLLILAASCRALPGSELAHRLQRFSRQAQLIVLLLVIAGGWAALQLVGLSLPAFGTDYGITLILKIAFAAGAMSIALYNRLALTPAVRRGDATAIERLRIAIRFELAFIGAVAIATGVLTSTMSPPVLAG